MSRALNCHHYKRDVRIRGFFASPNSDVALLFHALFRVFFVVVFVVVIVIIAAAFFVVAAADIADANAAAGGRGRFGGRRFDAEMSVLFGSGRRRGQWQPLFICHIDVGRMFCLQR